MLILRVVVLAIAAYVLMICVLSVEAPDPPSANSFGNAEFV